MLWQQLKTLEVKICMTLFLTMKNNYTNLSHTERAKNEIVWTVGNGIESLGDGVLWLDLAHVKPND